MTVLKKICPRFQKMTPIPYKRRRLSTADVARILVHEYRQRQDASHYLNFLRSQPDKAYKDAVREIEKDQALKSRVFVTRADSVGRGAPTDAVIA